MADLEQTLKERGGQHGEFWDHAGVAQALKRVLVGSKRWRDLSVIQREALDMICHKMGRICSGNPDIADHWHDMAGYAKLVEDRLNDRGLGQLDD